MATEAQTPQAFPPPDQTPTTFSPRISDPAVMKRARVFYTPEHGGDAVSGGGHPADSPMPPSEPIDDAFAQDERGRGKVPGVGVPGSQNNPVIPAEAGPLPSQEEIARRAHQYWEQEGRPEDDAERHWFKAEADLRRRAGLEG
jgi:hypothetical protein